MITHEQATALRAIKIGFAVTPQSNAQPYLKRFIAAGSFIYWRLNDEGEAALAEYDREWVTVRREFLAVAYDLAREQADSERQIWAGRRDEMLQTNEAALREIQQVLEVK